MPTILECQSCGERYYTASRIVEGEESGDCEKCQGRLISLGFPGYETLTKEKNKEYC